VRRSVSGPAWGQYDVWPLVLEISPIRRHKKAFFFKSKAMIISRAQITDF
jgi:hypothetical protein